MQNQTDLSDEDSEIIERFEDELGYWPDIEAPGELDFDILAAYLDLFTHPRVHGPLNAKTEELVCLGLTAATTDLSASGIRIHTKRAQENGASINEILEVLYIASQLGNHAVTDGAPLLLEEVGDQNIAKEDDLREELHEQLTQQEEYWAGLYESMTALIELDPEFAEKMLQLTHAIYCRGALTRKQKELISIAIDASTTHLYHKGTETHIVNALEAGATFGEIMEVFELAAIQGVQTLYEGLPIAIREFKKQEAGRD